MPPPSNFFNDMHLLNTGLTGGISIGVSVYIGYKIDCWYSCQPYGTMGGIVIGISACVLELWAQISKQLENIAKNDRDKQRNK